MYIPQLNRPNNSINFLQLLFHFCEQFGICGVAVMVMVCGRHGLWPSCCGRHCLPCGRHGHGLWPSWLWPSWSWCVAVMVYRLFNKGYLLACYLFACCIRASWCIGLELWYRCVLSIIEVTTTTSILQTGWSVDRVTDLCISPLRQVMFLVLVFCWCNRPDIKSISSLVNEQLHWQRINDCFSYYCGDAGSEKCGIAT